MIASAEDPTGHATISEDSVSQDTQSQQAVVAELGWDPSVTAVHIGVTAQPGVVTVTGQVETFAGKHAIL
jgi:osmotically-inducible protein OsmY